MSGKVLYFKGLNRTACSVRPVMPRLSLCPEMQMNLRFYYSIISIIGNQKSAKSLNPTLSKKQQHPSRRCLLRSHLMAAPHRYDSAFLIIETLLKSTV
jgi:hypothetical protein